MNEHPPPPSSGTASGAAPVYDRADALARIADDEALFNELLDMFLGDVEGYLADIRQAIAGGDMAHLQRATHTLKGILATFSATPAQAEAQALEQAARNNQAELAGPGLERLERELARLLPVLRGDRQP